jgi:hypothetical protein
MTIMKNVTFTLSTVLPATLALFFANPAISLADTAAPPSPTTPSSAGQQYIDADYVSFFSGDFIKAKGAQALEGLFKNLNYSVNTLSVSSSPTLVLNNINITVVPKSYSVTDTSAGIAFQSVGNVVNLTIGEISVNEVIQENVGGVIASIQVTASCQGVTAQLADPNSIISGELDPVQNGNIVGVQLNNSVIKLGTPQWQMSSISCTGAQGFEQAINSTIQSSLQNSQLMTTLIQQNVMTSIQQAMSQMSYDWTTPQQLFSMPSKNGIGGVSAWIYPSSLKQINTNTWQSLGTTRFVLPYPRTGPVQHFPLNTTVDYSQLEGQTVFAISETAVTALIQAYFAPAKWSYKGLANSISGFNSFFHSGFEKWLFWGDLQNWPLTTQFPLIASTSTTAGVSWTSSNSLSLKTTLKVDMDAGSMPYVHFQIPLQGNLQMSVANNQIVFKPSNASISMNYVFDPKYCARGGTVCGSIATWVIESSVQSYLDAQTFSFPMPQMEVVGGGQVTATGFEHSASLHSFLVLFDSN